MSAQPDPRPLKPRDVRKFTDHCVKLRSLWVHFHIIFEQSPLKAEMLQGIAPTFFSDLNELMIEQLVLQICRLTDPEFTGKKLRNFTVAFLINNADRATAAQKRELRSIALRISRFRKKIVPARNKRISHLDLKDAHRRTSIGGTTVEAWHQFWRDLREFLRIMHCVYLRPRTPFDLNEIGRLSDADMLIKAMKESTYFHAILVDHSLTNKVDQIAFRSKFYLSSLASVTAVAYR